MKPILILGLGNPLQGDDGVGCRVAQELEARTLPDNVDVIDGGTPGIGLLNLFEGRRRVIIVDAVEMGKAPGEVARFRPEDVTLTGSAERFSLHRSGVADALALASELKLALPDIIVFGIQPAQVGWGDQLSLHVQAAVEKVIDAIVGPDNILTYAWEQTMANEKILIIDDDDDVVLSMRLPLEANGYKVFRAASSQEGLAQVQEVRPDLILLDVMMDSTTAGFQLSLTLRNPDANSEYAAYRTIPILMITAIHTTTPLRFAPDQDYLPVDAFIEKPIEPSVLLAKVREYLGKK